MQTKEFTDVDEYHRWIAKKLPTGSFLIKIPSYRTIIVHFHNGTLHNVEGPAFIEGKVGRYYVMGRRFLTFETYINSTELASFTTEEERAMLVLKHG